MNGTSQMKLKLKPCGKSNTKQMLFVLIVGLLTLAGCAVPLDEEVISSHIARDVNIEASSIQYSTNCSFTVTAKTSDKGTWRQCVLSATDTALFVYVRPWLDGTLKQDLCLPYSEMRGIGFFKYINSAQIQILGDIDILALQVMGQNRIFLDNEATRNLYKFILKKGVPGFDAKKNIDIDFKKYPIILPIPISPSIIF
jgi:hypothetical protein